jgi:tRNA-modifying protein YgfZ
MGSQALQVDLDGQYQAMREGAGLLDRSDRGMLLVQGPDSAEYLQSQLTNDIDALAPGQGCYAALLERKGHMRADMRVLQLSSGDIWLDTEPIATEALLRHLETYKVGRQVEIEDVGASWAILSLIGPVAAELAGAPGLGLEHAQRDVELGGVEALAVATNLGLDLIPRPPDAQAVRQALVEAGAFEVSEEAAEILRVETGRPRFGAEMGEDTIPQEAGITDRAVNFEKGCYIGQETIARLHYKGKPNRHLRGLRSARALHRGDVVRSEERELGRVGTAVVSPAQGPISLAILRREAGPGDTVVVGEDGIEAHVTHLPFEH